MQIKLRLCFSLMLSKLSILSDGISSRLQCLRWGRSGLGKCHMLFISWLNKEFYLHRSVTGLPFKPLTFCHIHPPTFLYLEHLGRGPQVGLGFADDTNMFLKATNVNIATHLPVFDTYSMALGLSLDLQNFTMIDISAKYFGNLIWHGG